MVEQIVAFALGFSICGLIGLALLPMVSARARRLTLKRAEERLPMTFDEIEADRDLLRARFAVEKRELEVAVERERQLRAAESAENGRSKADLVRLEESLRARTAELETHKGLLAEAQEHRTNLAGELDGVREALAAREQELRGKQADYDALAEDHRALIGELDQSRSRIEQADRNNEAFEARRERLLAKIEAERKRADDFAAEIRYLRAKLAQGASDEETASLRAAILEIGQQIAAGDRAK